MRPGTTDLGSGYATAMNARDEYEVRSDRPVEIECMPDGPMLLRNASSLQAPDGTEHPVERPLVAVCVCGFSGRRPWCDGTHKVVPTERVRPVVLTFPGDAAPLR